MDEETQEYINMLFTNPDIDDSEFQEAIEPFVSPQDAVAMMEERRLYIDSITEAQKAVLCTIPFPTHTVSQPPTRIPEPRHTPPTEGHVPREIKAYVSRFSYVPVQERPCTPHLPCATQKGDKKKQCIRYRDGMVATSKGEKYITIA